MIVDFASAALGAGGLTTLALGALGLVRAIAYWRGRRAVAVVEREAEVAIAREQGAAAVVPELTDLIGALRKELQDARADAQAARTDAQSARTEAQEAKRETLECERGRAEDRERRAKEREADARACEEKTARAVEDATAPLREGLRTALEELADRRSEGLGGREDTGVQNLRGWARSLTPPRAIPAVRSRRDDLDPPAGGESEE